MFMKNKLPLILIEIEPRNWTPDKLSQTSLCRLSHICWCHLQNKNKEHIIQSPRMWFSFKSTSTKNEQRIKYSLIQNILKHWNLKQMQTTKHLSDVSYWGCWMQWLEMLRLRRDGMNKQVHAVSHLLLRNLRAFRLLFAVKLSDRSMPTCAPWIAQKVRWRVGELQIALLLAKHNSAFYIVASGVIIWN